MPDIPRPRPTIADLLAAHGPQPARYERDTPLPRPDPRPGQVAIPESAYVPLDAEVGEAPIAGLAEALAERDRALLLDFIFWFVGPWRRNLIMQPPQLVADFLRETRGVGAQKEADDATGADA